MRFTPPPSCPAAEGHFSLNPLTYVVDALRTSMLAGSTSTFSLSQDYAVIVLTTARCLIASRLYPRLCNVDRLSLGAFGVPCMFWSYMDRGRRGLCGFLNAHPVPPMLEAVEVQDTPPASCIESATGS